jgi:predicted oxidoreductase
VNTPTYRSSFLEQLSPIAFGCWRFHSMSVADATLRIRTAVDAGLTLIDTADIYGYGGGPRSSNDGFGESEELLGAVLAADPGLRDQIVVATKGGITPPVPYDQSEQYLTAAAEASLRRLGVDQIDLYQIHRPDLLAHPGEIASALAALVSAGKVGHIGVSNFTVAQHRALDVHLRAAGIEEGIVTSQPEWNPLHLDPLFDGTLDWCMEVGARPLIWSPLAGGALVAEGESDAEPATGGHAGGRGRVRETAERLAADLGCSPTSVFLAWVLRHPSGAIPIVGTQNPERIAASAEAAGVSLSRSQWYELLVAARGEEMP